MYNAWFNYEIDLVYYKVHCVFVYSGLLLKVKQVFSNQYIMHVFFKNFQNYFKNVSKKFPKNSKFVKIKKNFFIGKRGKKGWKIIFSK